ncbi:Dps family protein [Pseudoclavibacter sp. 13-3]|uniref:Dps family protein n=1 Tax=Pseudoclavibacter sp. 13-3 TaxID=2901228 RepID=UPI001E376049|nr:DNA starvation/stationary phase protection protein [Pseudoclavibacter sp. 13-3]MCD7100821.1 DNA starvation/stationary phase protection protein [Pseudoclavibacter sp. 13-3]
MTTTTVAPVQTSVTPDTVSGVAQFLQPVVVELTALSVNAKQLHWHVRGANFGPIHELLDDLVAHARDWADLAAERVVALGLPVDGRLQTVSQQTTSPVLADGFQQSPDTIAAAIANIDAALKVVHTAVVELDGIDLSSQDVAIEIERGLDKDRWFFFAHIAEA